MKRKNWRIFILLLLVLVIDRSIAILNFGSQVTDVDQLILWNATTDYSNGIFHEPFFYGQSFNYMLEALLAVPLVSLGISHALALPIVSSFLAIFPFLVLAVLLFKNNFKGWSYLILILPILLPLEYTLLTNLSRGWMQAHLFIPLLFPILFKQKSTLSIVLFYLGAGISFIANPSAIVIILPIALYSWYFNFKNVWFYAFTLLLLPIFWMNYEAVHFYDLHLEKLTNPLVGLNVDLDTFASQIISPHLFDYLIPFIDFPGWIIILVLFILLIATSLNRSLQNRIPGMLFLSGFLAILLISIGIPKVQEYNECTGFFFTSSRFYLLLPIMIVLSFFLIFKDRLMPLTSAKYFILITLVSLGCKHWNTSDVGIRAEQESCFPSIQTAELLERHSHLNSIAKSNEVSLIINCPHYDWNVIMDSYAFYPLERGNSPITSLIIEREKRTWLYQDTSIHQRILLNGFITENLTLEKVEHRILNKQQILIIKNDKDLQTLGRAIGLYE